jgi:hypothetical protein
VYVGSVAKVSKRYLSTENGGNVSSETSENISTFILPEDPGVESIRRDLHSISFDIADSEFGNTPATFPLTRPPPPSPEKLLMLSNLLYDAALGSPLEGKKNILINLCYSEIKVSVFATNEMLREYSEKWGT